MKLPTHLNVGSSSTSHFYVKALIWSYFLNEVKGMYAEKPRISLKKAKEMQERARVKTSPCSSKIMPYVM